jgi:tRNA A-37 threonylcarbamoyl transferase component Bud32
VKRTVYVDGTRLDLAPAQLLGQGGEAEVYDLGDGLVVKWWKPADHPDFDGLPDAQAAATHRLAEAPARLRALPGRLPAGVVAPCGLALDRKKAVIGYLMPKVAGTPLASYGEPRWRRDHPTDPSGVVAALCALRDAIAGLHAAGVVIGDCNDHNVLVDGRRVHLIDVDSYQLPGFPCVMFTERFVDPRLCDAALAPARPHDTDSDWFAFAAMAFRTLLWVPPYGGVHPRCPNPQRGLRRLSALGPDVVYPRAARPVATLPDELVDAFRAIFERDVRGAFPGDLLARLHVTRCAACGEDHARVRCPACQATAARPPVVVHGRLRWQPIPAPGPDLACHEVTAATRPVWLAGGALYRATRVGPERVGSVLAGQTRAWCGTQFGVGYYRAGGFAVGFTFRPDRGGLDDRLALPRIRGRLVDAHAVVGDDLGWLFLVAMTGTTVVVVGADGTVRAADTVDAPWLAGAPGAVAAGPHLFVPTDDGVARVEIVQGAILQTRAFAETAPLVSCSDRLALSPGGLDVIRARDAIRIQLS